MVRSSENPPFSAPWPNALPLIASKMTRNSNRRIFTFVLPYLQNPTNYHTNLGTPLLGQAYEVWDFPNGANGTDERARFTIKSVLGTYQYTYGFLLSSKPI